MIPTERVERAVRQRGKIKKNNLIESKRTIGFLILGFVILFSLLRIFYKAPIKLYPSVSVRYTTPIMTNGLTYRHD